MMANTWKQEAFFFSLPYNYSQFFDASIEMIVINYSIRNSY